MNCAALSSKRRHAADVSRFVWLRKGWLRSRVVGS
jgi:hypothetical protein